MIETIFDAPHYATEAEMRALYSYQDRADLEANGPKSDDNRILYLWELYRLRGNAEKMAEQEARLHDPHYLDDVKYRDTFVDIATLTV